MAEWVPVIYPTATTSEIVPADQAWDIQSVYVGLTATGTAGNRRVAITIKDPEDVTAYEVRAGAVQAASTIRYYLFAPGAVDLETFRDTDYLSVGLSAVIIPTGYTLQVRDVNSVDDSDVFTVAISTMQMRMKF